MRADALFLVPAVAAAAALDLGGRRTDRGGARHGRPNVGVDPREGAIFASVSVPGGPSRLATDGSCRSEATPPKRCCRSICRRARQRRSSLPERSIASPALGAGSLRTIGALPG